MFVQAYPLWFVDDCYYETYDNEFPAYSVISVVFYLIYLFVYRIQRGQFEDSVSLEGNDTLEASSSRRSYLP